MSADVCEVLIVSTQSMIFILFIRVAVIKEKLESNVGDERRKGWSGRFSNGISVQSLQIKTTRHDNLWCHG